MNSVKNSSNKRITSPLIIAVDGYSSCGKSTFARLIARELNFIYIDSGAMYRAVAYYGLKHNIIENEKVNVDKLIGSLDEIEIRFEVNGANGIQETLLNNENIEIHIRGIEVSKIVSKVSQIKEVRQKMISLQRKMGEKGNIVMDGRDIGSTVFPNATLKIFMTADTIIRANRRFKELTEKGIKTSLDDIISNIQMRDHEDETRKESPLRRATDAVILDNSHLTIEEQMYWFRKLWNEKITRENENRN